MISDAYVLVSCDGQGCRETVEVPLRSGAQSTYLYSDDSVINYIEPQGWFLQDGQHFCSQDCAPNATN